MNYDDEGYGRCNLSRNVDNCIGQRSSFEAKEYRNKNPQITDGNSIESNNHGFRVGIKAAFDEESHRAFDECAYPRCRRAEKCPSISRDNE